jgi:inner membrane protein
MPWWLWILVGFALLLAELAVPSDFFLFFFGLSAVLVGAGMGLGLVGPSWAPWGAFAVLTIASLLLLRRPLREWLGRPASSGMGDRMVGEMARLTHRLLPGEIGKAELRGSVWSVRSRATVPLEAGHLVRVERIEGLTLWVVAEGTAGS